MPAVPAPPFGLEPAYDTMGRLTNDTMAWLKP